MARWLIALVVVALLVGLIAFARGREHHRGDDVGTQGARAAATSTS